MPKVIKKSLKEAKNKSLKKTPVSKKAIKKPKHLKDSDGDGLSDFDEKNIFGSDPYNADSNSDGIEDGEAVLNGCDPVTGHKLRDFFIPHAGNNYQPPALQPRRVLFHATAAIAIKAIVVLFVASYPLLAWMTPDVIAAEGQKIIALTNDLRNSLALKPLTENAKLDAAAAKKVEDMFINQYFAHVSPRGLDLETFLALAGYKNYATVGENLAMGYANAADAMAAWKKSPTHYANLIDTNYSQIGVSLAGGLYAETDTVFIAQYFGLPNIVESAAKATPATVNVASDKTTLTGEKAVLAGKAESALTPRPVVTEKVNSPITPKKAAPAPILTTKEATITVDTPMAQPETKVIKVEAVLPKETASAVASVEDNNIILEPVGTSTMAAVATSSVAALSGIAEPQETLWVGQIAVTKDKAENVSVVPPTILATDTAGNTAAVMITPESVKPQQTSMLDQYVLFKTHPSTAMGKILDASSLYFKLLLILVMSVLALSIFINIRKQHYKPILSGVGLIMLLGLLIVF